MDNLVGIISFSCDSKSSNVLLAKTIFALINDTVGVHKSKLTALEVTEEERELYFIAFRCDRKFFLSDVLSTDATKETLIKIAKADGNTEWSEAYERGVRGINSAVSASDLAIGFYDLITCTADVYLSTGKRSARHNTLSLDTLPSFPLSSLVILHGNLMSGFTVRDIQDSYKREQLGLTPLNEQFNINAKKIDTFQSIRMLLQLDLLDLPSCIRLITDISSMFSTRD